MKRKCCISSVRRQKRSIVAAFSIFLSFGPLRNNIILKMIHLSSLCIKIFVGDGKKKERDLPIPFVYETINEHTFTYII